MRSGCLSKSGLSRSEFNETLPQRFERKCGAPDARGCIPWLGTKTGKGYGSCGIDNAGASQLAHRVAWVLSRGDLSPAVMVLHRCDNPSCVNVDHLFLGSPQANTDDMVSKRRHPWRNPPPWQKLNSTDVERIRDLRACGHTQREVSEWMGVSRPLISMIEHGRIKHAVTA